MIGFRVTTVLSWFGWASGSVDAVEPGLEQRCPQRGPAARPHQVRGRLARAVSVAFSVQGRSGDSLRLLPLVRIRIGVVLDHGVVLGLLVVRWLLIVAALVARLVVVVFALRLVRLVVLVLVLVVVPALRLVLRLVLLFALVLVLLVVPALRLVLLFVLRLVCLLVLRLVCLLVLRLVCLLVLRLVCLLVLGLVIVLVLVLFLLVLRLVEVLVSLSVGFVLVSVRLVSSRLDGFLNLRLDGLQHPFRCRAGDHSTGRHYSRTEQHCLSRR